MTAASMSSSTIDLLTSLGHGVCAVDSEGNIRAWQGPIAEALPAARVLGRCLGSALELLQADNTTREALLALASDDATSTAPRESVTIRFATPTLEGRAFRVLAQRQDGADHALLVFQDRTETERLRDQLETVLNSTPDGIFVIDRHRQVVLHNRAFRDLTGRDPMELLRSGCSCADLVQCHGEGGESYASGRCPAKAVFSGADGHRSEQMLLTNAAGEERWIETTYSSIRDDAGAVNYVVAVLRDIHERKLLEERLHQTEKLASLGQLVAGIAHEIKNPLAIILSSLDVMQSARHSPEQQREAAGFIREEIRRIDDRLRAFLAFARPRAIEPRPFDLPALLQRRVERIAGLFPGVTITIDTAPNAATMRGDEEQLDQVLTNLLMNAGEAAGGNGAILLRTRRLGDTIVLDVEDSGPGVPEEFHARVFDPFFTTKSDGTGLGLSICYQIILAHGGTISVGRARTLSGACFSVRIPLAEGRAAAPAAP